MSCEHDKAFQIFEYEPADQEGLEETGGRLDAVEYCPDCSSIRLWGCGWMDAPRPSDAQKKRLEEAAEYRCEACNVVLGESMDSKCGECLDRDYEEEDDDDHEQGREGLGDAAQEPLVSMEPLRGGPAPLRGGDLHQQPQAGTQAGRATGGFEAPAVTTLHVHVSVNVRYQVDGPAEADVIGDGPFWAYAGLQPGHRMIGRGRTPAEALASCREAIRHELGATGCPGIQLELHLQVKTIQFGRDGGGTTEETENVR